MLIILKKESHKIMENRSSVKLISIFTALLTISSCGTIQETPPKNNSSETAENSNPSSDTGIEGAIQYHMSVESNPEYVLPTENVLVYKQYSMEELIKKSPTGGGIMDNDLIPVFISLPTYPASAFEIKQQGDVIVEFTAPTLGKIKQIEVISSPENKDFQKHVLQSLQHWAFAPPRIKNTKYTVTNVRVKLEFRIENGNPVCYFKDETNTSGFYPPGAVPIKID